MAHYTILGSNSNTPSLAFPPPGQATTSFLITDPYSFQALPPLTNRMPLKKNSQASSMTLCWVFGNSCRVFPTVRFMELQEEDYLLCCMVQCQGMVIASDLRLLSPGNSSISSFASSGMSALFYWFLNLRVHVQSSPKLVVHGTSTLQWEGYYKFATCILSQR